jgi:kumamolisin
MGAEMRLVYGVLTLAVCFATSAWAQDPNPLAVRPKGFVTYPESSKRKPQALAAGFELKAKAYTNVAIFVPAVPIEPPTATAAGTADYFIETPASIACLYGLVPKVAGCNPNTVHANPTGGSKIIAIVDAFDAPNAANDLAAFSKQFGLPPAEFEVVFASGSRPEKDEGWEIEESLDIEWAHAMAPNAKVILVEAKSSSYDDLLTAEDKASQLVAASGGGEVSNSWGGSEFADEMSSDKHFMTKGVVYFAATGDDIYVSYPATSSLVVAVGGTSISRDATGAFIEELPWLNAGAGPSQFVKRPSYQDSLASILGGVRGVADISAVADPGPGGVWVYDSGNSQAQKNHGWLPIGGTSVATPIIAAIGNNAGNFLATSGDELSAIYNKLGISSFTDIREGVCGPSGTYSAGPGWDFCTGVGTPDGTGGL